MSAPAWVFQRGVLWAIDFGRAAPARAETRIAVRFAEVKAVTLEPLAQAMELPDASEVQRRFETGRRCFVGWIDDEVATYGWVTAGDEEVGELERTYHMRPGDAYIWHCATRAERRGQGLYSGLLWHINAVLASEGIRRAWIGTNLENTASLRAFARAGFVPVMEVAYARWLRLGGMWLIAQRGAPADMLIGAREMLVAPHERVIGTLAVGIRPSARTNTNLTAKAQRREEKA